MPFSIIRNDITKVETDAIVNAANTGLHQGGGVCGAIFHGAGEEEMRSACAAIGGCPTGEAVITPGFRLPARYVIHTAGPVWRGGGQGEETLLRSCLLYTSPAVRQVGNALGHEPFLHFDLPSLPDGPVSGNTAAEQRQHQIDGLFRHGSGIGSPVVADVNTQLPCSIGVNSIVSHPF